MYVNIKIYYFTIITITNKRSIDLARQLSFLFLLTKKISEVISIFHMIALRKIKIATHTHTHTPP
jgi:hypothetical protein